MYPTNAYNIRQATEADEAALHLLAELDSRPALTGPTLIGEIDGNFAAAISLIDGRTIADPFQQTDVLTQILRMRFGAMQAYSRTPSLPDRLGQAFAPFRARASEV